MSSRNLSRNLIPRKSLRDKLKSSSVAPPLGAGNVSAWETFRLSCYLRKTFSRYTMQPLNVTLEAKSPSGTPQETNLHGVALPSHEVRIGPSAVTPIIPIMWLESLILHLRDPRGEQAELCCSLPERFHNGSLNHSPCATVCNKNKNTNILTPVQTV